MITLAGDWMNSEYITIDEMGWHCSEDAPKEIKDAYNEFMEEVDNEPVLIGP